MRQLPNVLTSLNLLSGAVAITFITRGEYELALIPAGVSLLMDFLDGFAARMLNAYSSVGKQLDSLADLVAFGVAPSLLLFHLFSESTGGSMWSFAAFLYLLAAAWRLAIFNTDDQQERSFRGLPTPAAAIFVFSIPVIAHATLFDGSRLISDTIFLWCMLILPSLLMVSGLRLFSIKTWPVKSRDNIHRYLLLLILVVILLLQWQLAACAIVPVYVIVSLVFRRRVLAEESRS